MTWDAGSGLSDGDSWQAGQTWSRPWESHILCLQENASFFLFFSKNCFWGIPHRKVHKSYVCSRLNSVNGTVACDRHPGQETEGARSQKSPRSPCESPPWRKSTCTPSSVGSHRLFCSQSHGSYSTHCFFHCLPVFCSLELRAGEGRAEQAWQVDILGDAGDQCCSWQESAGTGWPGSQAHVWTNHMQPQRSSLFRINLQEPTTAWP